MSHYTVLVIGGDVEAQLAPYDENLSVEAYPDYVTKSSIRYYMDAWKRRDEPETPQQSLHEALDKEPLPPLSIDHLPDPTLVELVDWLNEEWQEEWRLDDRGMYRMTTYNPRSKWDWYTVGGRWRGYFKLKPHVMDDANALAVIGRPGVFDNEPKYDADHVRKGDVDVEGMRNLAGKEAGKDWDRAQAVIGELPEALSWRQVCARHTDESGEKTDYEAAREEYHAQDRVVAAREHDHECMKEGRHDDLLVGFFDNIESYQVTRESFVQDARDNALAPYAYLKDGEWHAPGEMGWFGSSTDTEKEKRRFVKEFNKMFDALPDNTMLTLVDCHI